jgi:hypothetical protein
VIDGAGYRDRRAVALKDGGRPGGADGDPRPAPRGARGDECARACCRWSEGGGGPGPGSTRGYGWLDKSARRTAAQ